MSSGCPVDATPLTRLYYDDIPFCQCSQCHGLWMEAGALKRLTFLPATQPGPREAITPEGITPARRKGVNLHCPDCAGQPLAIKVSEGVEIDVCPSCGGIWLDAGEIEALQRIYEKQLSTTPPVSAEWSDSGGWKEWLDPCNLELTYDVLKSVLRLFR